MTAPVMAPTPSVQAWLRSEAVTGIVDGASQTSSDERIADLDPATGKELAAVPTSSVADVAAAVESAHSAFVDGRWSRADPTYREAVLLRLADLVGAHASDLAQIEALDTGKPLAEAHLDIAETEAVLRYYAGWASKVEGAVLPVPPEFFAYTAREPLGVCAAITPWNYPLPILTYKLAPALAAGNTFVAKPSELAPLSTIYLAQLCLEAGVPDGVVNVVLGGGSTGAALAAHPWLEKMAFTGSTSTGRKILQSVGDTFTRVTLELGGKSPQLVFADADLEAAAAGVLQGIWTNAGQLCVAGSRLLVQESIRDEFVAELVSRTSAVRLGHSLDPATTMGPVITKVQQQKIGQYLTAAIDSGITAAVGGTAPDRVGNFVDPTILTDVPTDAPVFQEELFGPVLTVSTFRTEAEAVEMANSTRYGLAAGVWTDDASRVHRISRALRAGSVWINTYGIFHPTVPFGGRGQSGFGRELGGQAMSHYTELKSVVQQIAPLR